MNRNVYQQNAVEGFNKIIRTYCLLSNCSTKAEGDVLWSDLTRSITLFRRALSRLESHAYDGLSMRFSSPQMRSDCYSGSVSSSSTSDELEQPRGKELDKMDRTRALGEIEWKLAEEERAAIEKQKEEGSGQEEEVVMTTSDKREEKPAAAEPFNEHELRQEWTAVLRDVAERMPLPIPFSAGTEFAVKALFVVSPLEFYVIKKSHLERLDEVERILSDCDDKLRRQPLPPCEKGEEERAKEPAARGRACLAALNGKLHRAQLKVEGDEEAQVFLVDSGRTCFVARSSLFSIPRCIANMAPPLAHFCSLPNADSRALDVEAVKSFQQRMCAASEIILMASGESRRTHGELVEIKWLEEEEQQQQKATPPSKESPFLKNTSSNNGNKKKKERLGLTEGGKRARATAGARRQLLHDESAWGVPYSRAAEAPTRLKTVWCATEVLDVSTPSLEDILPRLPTTDFSSPLPPTADSTAEKLTWWSK